MASVPKRRTGIALRTVSNFYGGAIGADRLVRPDLRLAA